MMPREGTDWTSYCYVCIECGRRMIAIWQPRPHANTLYLCGLCQAYPLWFNNTEARRVFDPDNTANPPAIFVESETP